MNNAAVGGRDPDIKTCLPRCIDTNVVGPALVSAASRPSLLKSQELFSIYVSSAVGSMAMASDPTSTTYRGSPNREAYRASKAAQRDCVTGVD